MRKDTFLNLQAKAKELRKMTALVDGRPAPASIKFLEDELKRSEGSGSRSTLYGLIRDECAIAGLKDMELEVLRSQVLEFPDEPVPLAILAMRLGSEPTTLAEARRIIEEALTRAIKDDRFVRYVLGVRARIARSLKDNGLFEDCLRKLIADSGTSRIEDCGFETDFLRGLDHEMSVDQSLVDRYRHLGHGLVTGLESRSASTPLSHPMIPTVLLRWNAMRLAYGKVIAAAEYREWPR